VKYSVITFGCRVNQADSLGFEGSSHRRDIAADDASATRRLQACRPDTRRFPLEQRP